jgi:polyferredoxin
MKRISVIRAIVQNVFLVLVVYGGLVVFQGRKISLPPVFAVAETPDEFKTMSATKTAPLKKQTFNMYLPFKTCRYARGLGAFRGCTFHFIQESLAWQDPFRIWAPYLAVFLVLAILLGRFTCGWVCPMGFMQDLLASLRRWLKIPELKVAEQARANLRNAGIGLILLVMGVSWVASIKTLPWEVRDGLYLAGCQICPARVVYSLMTGYPIAIDLWRPMFLALFAISTLFALFFMLSFFVNRIWCSFCPNGILISLFNRGKFVAKEKDLLKCARCGVCANACPMESTRVYQDKDSPFVDQAECINCYRCVEKCPQRSLGVKFFGLKLF